MRTYEECLNQCDYEIELRKQQKRAINKRIKELEKQLEWQKQSLRQAEYGLKLVKEIKENLIKEGA